MQVRFARLSACRLALAVASLIAAVSLTTGCGSIEGPLGNLTAISASSASLRVNQQLQIQSRMDITAVPLTWSVNGIRGGNSEVGTITFNGLYTAPASVPTPNTVTITATANGQPNYPPGTLTLSVLNPIPVLSNVAPTNITEGNPTISVNGSQFVYGAQVLWNGAAVPTTFVSSTELVAAIPAPNPGNYPLLVNNPNPGSANSNNLTVLVGPGQVVLAIQPGQNTDVRVTNSINLGLHRHRNQQHRRHAAGERRRRRQCHGRHRGLQCRWLHHLYRAGRCPHAQQHRRSSPSPASTIPRSPSLRTSR